MESVEIDVFQDFFLLGDSIVFRQGAGVLQLLDRREQIVGAGGIGAVGAINWAHFLLCSTYAVSQMFTGILMCTGFGEVCVMFKVRGNGGCDSREPVRSHQLTVTGKSIGH